MEKEFFVNVGSKVIILPKDCFDEVMDFFNPKDWGIFDKNFTDRTSRRWLTLQLEGQGSLEGMVKKLKSKKFKELSRAVYQARFSTL